MKEKIFDLTMNIVLIIGFTLSCLIFIGISYGFSLLFNITFHIIVPLILWLIIMFFVFVFTKTASMADEELVRQNYNKKETME